MSRPAATARWQALASLVPAVEGVIVDVGADHGHLAYQIGAIATERAPRRIGRRDVPWVLCDGLSAFHHVDVAIIAGMGAHTIAGIVRRGPRPRVLVVHAPDDPPALRRLLAGDGWRLEAEVAVPEGPRLAECMRWVPGVEHASGPELSWGPLLLRDPDAAPFRSHLRRQRDRLAAIVDATASVDPSKHAALKADVSFLDDVLSGRWRPGPRPAAGAPPP